MSQGVYFERLAESRFSICPAGRGVQSPKIVEAVLMNTVRCSDTPRVVTTPSSEWLDINMVECHYIYVLLGVYIRRLLEPLSRITALKC